MTILLGLLVAAGFGSADFLGGAASRRSPSGAVTVGSQLGGLSLGLVYLLLFRADVPSAKDVVLSGAAGASGVLGLALLYRGLAVGRMSVVAPASAVIGAIVPITWGLVAGERPSGVALAGVALAVCATGLVGATPEAGGVRGAGVGDLLLGLAAGAGFGTSFVFFAEASGGTGMWPVVLARLVAVPLVLTSLIVTRRTVRWRRQDSPTVIGAGALDVTANAFVLLAFRRGLISLVAPVAALYPAVTVILARFVLYEPVGRERAAGLALAVAGLVMIAAGR